jgi:predicted dehydrogenase
MIRVAIIGAGIGAEHLVGYRALPDRFTVATLCDLDTARATCSRRKRRGPAHRVGHRRDSFG